MKKPVQIVIQPEALYVIAAANGRVLEVANYNTNDGAAVQLWDYAGEPWQQWTFAQVGENTYRIKNKFTGKLIDLALRGTQEGTLLHQWSQTTHPSQTWRLEPASRGTRIRNVHADKCIDLAEMGSANGTRAQIWTDVEGGSQEWTIRRVDDKPAKQTAAAPKQAAPKDVPKAAETRKSETVKKIAGKTKTAAKRKKKD